MISLVRAKWLFGLIALLSMSSSAFAEAPSPWTRIDQIYGHIKTAANTATTQEELTTRLTAELDGFIDYQAFSARTLKTSWSTLTPAQQATFMDRFKRLVVRTYVKKFQPKTEFTVERRGDVKYEDGSRNEATVMTTVRGKKVAADVDYIVRWDASGKLGWRAFDIVIDDVSMALNWRKQFEKIIAKEGFDALISRINKKVDKADKGEPEGAEQ
jgi:phospholipid transport system substrate-binding protein